MHKARMQALGKKQSLKREMQLEYFSTMAQTIQRFFRGFYERKYKHDYYARKKYLNNVMRKNEQTLRNLNDYQMD